MTSTAFLSKAIVICGKTGSGKSTAVQAVSRELGFKVVSFGSLVRDRALALSLHDSRDALQQLGYEMFNSLGASKLLQAAVEHAGLQKGDWVVFDGVRHRLVLSLIQDIAEEMVTFYLQIDERQRYARYLSRSSDVPLSFEQFLVVDTHPIEGGIEELASMADVVIDATLPPQAILAQMLAALAARGLVKSVEE